MAKQVQISVARRQHPTENYDEVVITKTVTITQEEAIPLDLLPSMIASLRADRERLLADVAEIERQIEALQQILTESSKS